MYLKKITSVGFKSFAERITVNFEKNHIAGIVGPNGSGKSNVIDAVRWVMGEQNAKMLRGEKTTDIIFSGSEKRKPLAMAEVTLVFDNSEASKFCPPEYRHEEEISLTRRLYLDGQREYFINKKPCRLKDIVGFFTSTGLGGRSYSMIQQGQVDRILQAKPEQLREIVEEAAGINIFKNQRLDANKKLEQTELHMSRIDDILKEVERQMDALKEQVEKAEKWKSLSDQLREKELNLFQQNYLYFNQKEQEIKHIIENSSLKEVACITEITQLEYKAAELKRVLNEADPELHKLSERITQVREKIAGSEAKLSNFYDLQTNGNEQIQSLQAELGNELEEYERSKEQLVELRRRLDESSENKIELESQLEEMQQQLEIAMEEEQVFRSKIEDFVTEKQNLDRLIDSNRMRKENIEREYSKASREMAEYTEKVTRIEEEHSHLQMIAEGCQVKANILRKGVDQEVAEKHNLETNLLLKQDRLEQLQQKHEQSRAKYLESNARYESLKESMSFTEGHWQEAQKMKQETELIDIMADYISFAEESDRKLPKEVKIAFGKWCEQVYISDQQNLKGISEKIRAYNLGGIYGKTAQKEYSVAVCKEWAEKFELKPIKNHLIIQVQAQGLQDLLSCIYFADELQEDQLFEIWREAPKDAILFSKSGLHFYNSNNFIFGYSEGHSILELKEKLETFDKERVKQLALCEEITHKIIGIKEKISSTKEKIKDINAVIHSKNQDMLEVLAELETTKSKLNYQQELIVSARKEYVKLDELCEQYGTELEDLNSNERSLKTEREQTELEYQDAKEQIIEISDKKEEIKRQNDQVKIDLASVKTLFETLQEHYVRDANQFEGMERKLEKRRLDLENYENKVRESSEKIADLEEDIRELILDREDLDEQLNAKKQTNAGIVEELNQIENRLGEARSVKDNARRALSEKEIELERIKSAVEGFIQQSLEKYSIDPRQQECEYDEKFDSSKESRLVGSLKSKLDSLGAINMMAVDEYRDLKVRQDFMLSQKGEVDSAIGELQVGIEEIEEKSKARFMKTYHDLNHEFKNLFPILFPRGEGHIQLLDEENPLETGLEIYVRLPGKNRQSMRLFSGGEKALTAIALIFALLKSKPTPFCFLDEVDAPLDETNVGRYNKVLEALSDRFQFIVITHRRKTMEVLDSLFGVTMQEPGVSKVVGVDLAKALPTHLQKAFKEEKRQGASASASAAADANL